MLQDKAPQIAAAPISTAPTPLMWSKGAVPLPAGQKPRVKPAATAQVFLNRAATSYHSSFCNHLHCDFFANRSAHWVPT